MLRDSALRLISALEIEGGCNVQFALDPNSFDYAVIEVNPRVSRSSALASKATGYPIAKVTTKIALGFTLDEITNEVTGKTTACFEPAIDYIVVKLPKWPFDKFHNASHTLGTQMKATGEVMAIATSFEAALMKAVRGAELSLDTLNDPKLADEKDILKRLKNVDDMRLFTVFEAIKRGVGIDTIYDITKIDRWFLHKISNLANYEKELAGNGITDELYLKGKCLGYTDAAISRIGRGEIKQKRRAVYKMVDTCSAEFAAETPYFYSAYDGECEAAPLVSGGEENKRIIVLGSGPIRIGQGIEFDYSSVHCVWALKRLGYEVIIINNNPETVSTDFDTADRLYFEPLTNEDVYNIIQIEKPLGVVVAFGGQTAIKLTKFLDKMGVRILGTSAESIDIAEDRGRFDEMLEKFSIKRPKGMTAMTKEDALAAAEKLGYPVLLRPSYVIGGQNMTIAYTENHVSRYMDIILSGKIENPVLIDKYLMGKELEVDVISDGEDVLIPGVMEHIERAGVHSGDSIAVYPQFNISDKLLSDVTSCATKLALSLGTKGIVNIQFLIYQNELYVIEVNPRASRTVPYISKVTGVPMVELAARVMLGEKLRDLGYGTGLYKQPPYVAVKVPVFSFEKLDDVDSSLSPEMKSTGEVLGIGKTLEEALYKGLVSAGYRIQSALPDRQSGVLISVSDIDKYEIVSLAKKFDDLGFKIYATEGTAQEISSIGIEVEIVEKLRESDRLLSLLESGKINYILYTAENEKSCVDDFILLHRRALQLSIACLTSLDTASALVDIIASRYNQSNTELVDLNHMRSERQKLKFSKMEGSGNDYIYFENFNGEITCPESLSIALLDRHRGIGGDGIVLIENSDIADKKMRIFNKDGSEGKMAGNSIRCVAKYLYDKGIVKKENMRIETVSGVKELALYTFNGKAGSVRVNMGRAEFDPKKVPVLLDGERVIGRNVVIGGQEYSITCVSLGNPHCVVFCPKVDDVDIKRVGPLFENSPLFPDRVNAGFARVVNRKMLKLRVWERGNGETLSCGTGACAAVIAAVENGFCDKGADITVKVRGGDLVVNYTDDAVYLTGNARLIFEGVIEY
jgi:carbamoyl-phosphate synthase large subunit